MKTSVTGRYAAIATLAALLGAAAPAPQLTVAPADGQVDAQFEVRVSNAPPGARVTIVTTRGDRTGHDWTASGVYVADANGSIDTRPAPSLGGTYEGVSPHGLWCSALPVPPDSLPGYIHGLPDEPARALTPPTDPQVRHRIRITASLNGRELARVEAWLGNNAVASENVRFVHGSAMVARCQPSFTTRR